MGWYVVETELKRETVAQDCIHELGLETFFPKKRRINRSHHRFADPFLPIFPRYLFVQFDLAEDKFVWPAIRRQRGVRNILGASGDGIPTAVRPKDFVRLQEIATELAESLIPGSNTPKALDPGTVVRILWGPFRGLVGKIEIDNGIRADVLLDASGLFNKIPVSREYLEAVR